MKVWPCGLLIALGFLATTCAPAPPAPVGAFSAATLTVAALATPEPIRPVTATPLPVGNRPIYIVDPSDGDLVTRIIAVDPDVRRVVRMIGARHDPEVAFSPDGKQMYVVDSYSTRVIRGEWRDVVSVYDAHTGELLTDDAPITGRLRHKIYPVGHPYVFLSHDGRRLFVRKYGVSDIHALRLAVLDPGTLKLMAEYKEPGCGDLLPLSDGRLLCTGQAQPRLVDPLTGMSTDVPVSLPAISMFALLSSSGNRAYLLTSDARIPAQVTVVDFAKSPPQIAADRVALSAPPDSHVGFNHVAVGVDESRLYIGFLPETGENFGRGLAEEVRAFDTQTWEHVGTFKPTDPAFHIAVSNDGTQVYTVNPSKKTLSIFDAATFREIAVMHDFGDTPARIVVPPK